MAQQQKSLIPFQFFRFPTFFEEFEEESKKNWPYFSGKSDIEITSDDKNLFVKVATPGLDPKDIEITLENGMLWIRGEKKESTQEKEKGRKVYRQASWSYSYHVALPEKVDETKEIKATANKGILEITLPKTKQSQTKKITVKGS